MKSVFTLLGLLFLTSMVNLASAAVTRFWVANSSTNWNSTSNWATSSGGAGGASVPGLTDNAVFDNGGTGNCNVDIPVTITNLTVNSTYSGTIIQGAHVMIFGNNVTLAGGVFAGGSSNITVAGTFTLSGTAFTATSAILELDGNSAFTGGSFAHNNGTVRYNGAGTQTISGTSPNFYTLELVGNGHNFALSSTPDITVANSLNITGTGTYNINAGIIDANGDINITNTATGCAGTALINISGTGLQVFTGAAAAGQGALPKVTINKPSGALNLANFPTISNAFTYTAGTVNGGTSTVCFVDGSSNPYTISGSIALNNIEFMVATNGTFTVGAATTLTAGGDLTLAGTANLTLNTGNINVNGNIILTNTATGGGGSATINIVGAGAQAVDGTAITANENPLALLTINKSGGTLTFAGNISLTNNVTYTAGTVNPGISTVYIINGITVAGSFPVDNLTINGAAGTISLTVTTGSTLTVTGTLDLENAANRININTGTVAVLGDIIDNNTNTGGGGTGTVLINGTGAQHITSTGVADQGSFPAVTINKTGGTLTLPALITVTGNWTYVAGTIDVTSNNSTVLFSSASFTLAGTHTLNDVTFEANGSHTFTFNAPDIMTISGTLSITGVNNITLNSNGVNGTTGIWSTGNISISSTGAGGGGTVGILINGTGAQTITGSSASGQGKLPYITIQKTTGTLTLIGTITESRNWTWNSGTVDASSNTATVVFGGNSLNLTSAGMSFYHVIVTANTTTLTNDLTVAGNLIINGTGTLAAGGNNINLNGNWTNRLAAGFTEATSTVNFIGTSLQTITTPGGESFNNLTVSNTGTGIQLASAVTVATTLTMTTGNIDLNSNALTLGTSTANLGTLIYTTGNMINSGTFTRWFKNAAIAGNAGLFPLGTSTDPRPFSVSTSVSPTAGGTISVAYTDAVSNSAVNIPDDFPNSVIVRKDLHWTVTRSAALSGGSYNLQVSGTNFGLVGNVAFLRISLAGSVVGSPGANGGTNTNPQVNRTGLSLTNLSNTFYLGSVNGSTDPLPVKLLFFTASTGNEGVALTWRTAAWVDEAWFVVERSPDGTHWEELERVAGAGASSQPLDHTAKDLHPYPGKSFYRLILTDRDGQSTYSKLIVIDWNTKARVSLYPNPASDQLSVTVPESGRFSLDLVNIGGQVVISIPETQGNRTTVNVAGLDAGIYFLHVSYAGKTETVKVMIRR
ncbi:MAG: T9SS type A sorting domain-containing protein [Bacteroidota bacterium]|nr:T9SS type A sorting domain-containing protein [Bacteroidota bacterium]